MTAAVDDLLLRERRGPVLVATINRPDKGNALSRPVLAALDALVDDLTAAEATQASDRARALVLTGAGEKAFSAGADITELDGITGSGAREQMRLGQAIFDRIEQLPLLVVAAVNGVAFGGGLELAMAADMRIAAPGARLAQPEITLGNLPGWGGTQRLPRLIGRGRATELILSGEPVDAGSAAAMGLVNRVAEDCLGEAVRFATGVAARNPAAVRGAKLAIHIGLTAGPAAGLLVEADAVAECCQTPEQRAAVQAFLNRRRSPVPPQA